MFSNDFQYLRSDGLTSLIRVSHIVVSDHDSLFPKRGFYNRERAHQGYRTQGRTPYQALVDGIAVGASPTHSSTCQDALDFGSTEVTPEAA